MVGQDARGDGEVGPGGEVDAPGEEGEPGCGCGAKDGCFFWGAVVSALEEGWRKVRRGERGMREEGRVGGVCTAAI